MVVILARCEAIQDLQHRRTGRTFDRMTAWSSTWRPVAASMSTSFSARSLQRGRRTRSEEGLRLEVRRREEKGGT